MAKSDTKGAPTVDMDDFNDPFVEDNEVTGLQGGSLADALSSQMDTLVAGGGDEADDLGLEGMDLSQVAGGGKIAPDDTWLGLEVIESKKSVSKTGNKQVAMKLRVIAPKEFAGGIIYESLVLIDSSMWKFKAAASACGLLSESGVFLGSGAAAFLGCKVKAQVITDTYNNRVKNKIKGDMEAYEEGELDLQ